MKLSWISYKSGDSLAKFKTLYLNFNFNFNFVFWNEGERTETDIHKGILGNVVCVFQTPPGVAEADGSPRGE